MSKPKMSQSLLLQVFVHTGTEGIRSWDYEGRNPFCYRSSFIRCRRNTTPKHVKLSQSLLLQVFVHTERNQGKRLKNCDVAIPSVTGLRSYIRAIPHSIGQSKVAIPSVTGLRSYSTALNTILCRKQVAIPSVTGLRSYSITHPDIVDQEGRNPFCYRSSFIQRTKEVIAEIKRSQSLLLQVFVHTTDLFLCVIYAQSQSLLLQVFVHTD